DLDTTDTQDQIVTTPADTLSVAPGGGFGVFRLVEWEQHSERVLIEHDTGNAKEYLLLDITNPQQARNLTREFKLNFEQPHLNASKENEMFAIIDGGLRFFDLRTLNVAAPVLEDIIYYEIKGDKTI